MKLHLHAQFGRLAKRLNRVRNIAAFALVLVATRAHASSDTRNPDLPSPVCDEINVPAGHRLGLHAYAIGVQIYRWNGAAWILNRPEAGLFADANYHGQIGIHYQGPTWEANDGSQLRGTVAERCTPFGDTIQWLLLEATPLQKHGRLARITYIQRVNTEGGKAPEYEGTTAGEEARIPYTAEYFFYREN